MFTTKQYLVNRKFYALAADPAGDLLASLRMRCERCVRRCARPRPDRTRRRIVQPLSVEDVLAVQLSMTLSDLKYSLNVL